MNTITIDPTRSVRWRPRPTSGAARATAWRIGLVVAATTACGLAAIVGEPSTLAQSDPELARLLHGMALIKAAMTVAAIGLAWWRLGRPIHPAVAIATGLAIVAMAAATVSIWRLVALLPAALVFHAGLFTLLFLAARGSAGAFATRPRRSRADAVSAVAVRPS